MLREEQNLETLLSFGEFHALFRHFQECSKNRRVVSIESICRALYADYTKELHCKILPVIQSLLVKNLIMITTNCPKCSFKNHSPLENKCHSCGRQVVGSSRIKYKEAPMQWLMINLFSLPKIKKFLDELATPSIPLEDKTKTEKSRTEFIKKWINQEIEQVKKSSPLELGNEDIKDIFHLYLNATKKLGSFSRIPKNKKYLLTVLHGFCKIKGKPLKLQCLLEKNSLKKKEFNSIRGKIKEVFPTYYKKSHQDRIEKQVKKLAEDFHLPPSFYEKSILLMKHLWSYLNMAKDDIVVSVVCSISLLINGIKGISINAICTYLNVAQSTVQNQIKRNIFDKLNLTGFTTLVQSADLLKKVWKNLLKYGELLPYFKELIPLEKMFNHLLTEVLIHLFKEFHLLYEQRFEKAIGHGSITALIYHSMTIEELKPNLRDFAKFFNVSLELLKIRLKEIISFRRLKDLNAVLLRLRWFLSDPIYHVNVYFMLKTPSLEVIESNIEKIKGIIKDSVIKNFSYLDRIGSRLMHIRQTYPYILVYKKFKHHCTSTDYEEGKGRNPIFREDEMHDFIYSDAFFRESWRLPGLFRPFVVKSLFLVFLEAYQYLGIQHAKKPKRGYIAAMLYYFSITQKYDITPEEHAHFFDLPLSLLKIRIKEVETLRAEKSFEKFLNDILRILMDFKQEFQIYFAIKKKRVSDLITSFTHRHALGSMFSFRSHLLLSEFYNDLKQEPEKMIAGIVCVTCSIYYGIHEKIKSQIFSDLNFPMKEVKKKQMEELFKRLGCKGFVDLSHSVRTVEIWAHNSMINQIKKINTPENKNNEIKRFFQKQKWTKLEELFLATNYKALKLKEMSSWLGKDPTTIQAYIDKNFGKLFPCNRHVNFRRRCEACEKERLKWEYRAKVMISKRHYPIKDSLLYFKLLLPFEMNRKIHDFVKKSSLKYGRSYQETFLHSCLPFIEDFLRSGHPAYFNELIEVHAKIQRNLNRMRLVKREYQKRVNPHYKALPEGGLIIKNLHFLQQYYGIKNINPLAPILSKFYRMVMAQTVIKKGYLAAMLYYFQEESKKEFTQDILATIFESTAVTIRIRLTEISKFNNLDDFQPIIGDIIHKIKVMEKWKNGKIKKKTKWIKSITSKSRNEPIVEDEKKISEQEKRRNIPAPSTPPQMENKEENIKTESQMIGTSFENNIRGWATKQLESISHDLELEIRKENITELIGLYEDALKRIEPSGYSQKHEKLLLVLLHGYCKIHDVPLERKDLVDNFFLDEKEFLSIRKAIQNILITYNEQVRQQEIRKIIENLTRELQLSDLFYRQSVSILERFWSYLNKTTSRVIAGVVCSINLLINEVDTLTVNHVCKYLKIAQSTIQSQVKKNIFDRLNISGFTTLSESVALLKKVCEKFLNCAN